MRTTERAALAAVPEVIAQIAARVAAGNARLARGQQLYADERHSQVHDPADTAMVPPA